MQTTAPQARQKQRHNEVTPLSATRYKVTFTASKDLVAKLEQAQALLSHALREQDIESVMLREKVETIAKEAWKPYRTLTSRSDNALWEPEERQWAEVLDFVPGWKRNHKKDGEPFRYIAIRIRSRQGDLFEADHERWRFFAVVTNMQWDGERLLRWHREKQGTVEHGHGVLKNELAGGTMPCGRFGSNAAWWRLNVLVHNLLQLIKVRSLPAQMHPLRPKALRFQIFNIVGRLIEHAHSLILRISRSHPWANAYAQARQSVLDLKRQARERPATA